MILYTKMSLENVSKMVAIVPGLNMIIVDILFWHVLNGLWNMYIPMKPRALGVLKMAHIIFKSKARTDTREMTESSY